MLSRMEAENKGGEVNGNEKNDTGMYIGDFSPFPNSMISGQIIASSPFPQK